MCCPNPEEAKIVLPMSYRIEMIEKNAGTRGVKEREENSIGSVQKGFWGSIRTLFLLWSMIAALLHRRAWYNFQHAVGRGQSDRRHAEISSLKWSRGHQNTASSLCGHVFLCITG